MTDDLSQRAIAPGIVRLTAPNAGPMTGPGTNTYVIGHNPAVVIDPAVDDAGHRDSILDAAAGPIGGILLTHRHPDHARGAAALAQASGAPLRAWPKTVPGRFDVEIGAYLPIADDEVIECGGASLRAIHTPGHAVDHLCFVERASGLLFAGDMVMTDSSVVILPPEGRMTDYFDSLSRLAALPITTIAPAHGLLMDQPARVWRKSIEHRRRREAQVEAALDASEPRSGDAVTGALYPRIDDDLRRVARAQVEAHLIRLAELGRAVSDDAGWRRAGEA